MKEKILGWLFSSYSARLEKDYVHKMQLFKASVDYRDLVRERLKGVRPGHPDDIEDALRSRIGNMDTPERLDFLSKAHAIAISMVFLEVNTDIMSRAMRRAALHAGDIEEVNFQRATINGIQLAEEEFNGLSALYLESKKEKEEMTLEEKLEVL